MMKHMKYYYLMKILGKLFMSLILKTQREHIKNFKRIIIILLVQNYYILIMNLNILKILNQMKLLPI